MTTCNFNNTITKRDMDMLLAQAVITDHRIRNIIIVMR